MQRISENALALAEFLDAHAKVVEVRYPMLPSDKNFSIAQKQMNGGGGVVTFDVGSLDNARALLKNLLLITIATSLGGVETVVEVPYELDFAEDEIGTGKEGEILVSPGFIRMSVGIENINDLQEDLESALSAVKVLKYSELEGKA